MTYQSLTAGNCFDPSTTNEMMERQQQKKMARKKM